jgi:glucokinase
VDLGKTKLAAGIVNVSEGVVVARSVVATDTSEEGAHIPSQLCGVIDELLNRSGTAVGFIGVATFGMVDSINGVALGGKGLPGFRDIPLARLLREKFAVPVGIENDVVAAAAGEYWYGLGDKRHTMTLLSLGTSAGVASVIEGELIRGSAGRAGQVAHLPLGQSGSATIGELIGGAGLANRASLLIGKKLSAKAIFEIAMAGDERLKKLIADWIDLVGQVIAWIVCLNDPPLIVLTGGLLQAPRDLLGDIHKSTLRALTSNWPILAQHGVKLVKSSLGIDGTLLGVTMVPRS